jgi:ketosteroid isomerase-like protein
MPVIARFSGAAAALLLAGAAPSPPAHVAPVVEAERAFSAAAQTGDTGAAFRRYVDPDRGILFVPDAAPAKPWFDAGHVPHGRLVWWPVYAGMAASGDLGFSTGPFEAGEGEEADHGWYFTIWGKRADGTWRWILDYGTPTSDKPAPGPEAPVEALAPAPRGASSPNAWAGVLAAEAELAAGLLADAPKALSAALANEGRIMRMGRQPAIGRDAFETAAASGPSRIAAWNTGGGVSRAGDLAFTYGDALWQNNGDPVRGHYVRVWQRRGRAWKLIVDEMTPVPRPEPKGAG